MLGRLYKKIAGMRVSHRLMHGALAGLYAGSCAGVDKTLIGALVAVCYGIMALECH